MDLGDRPLVRVMMTLDPGVPTLGPRTVYLTALLDSGADVTVIAERDWPFQWPKVATSKVLIGVGGEMTTSVSDAEVGISIINRDGSIEKTVFITPNIAPIRGSLLGRDLLLLIGLRLTNLS